MINICDLNQITQTNAYLMPFQTNIIAAVANCIHISIVDAQEYFYQWQIKKKYRHKQTIIIHRDQKQFNVTIMKFKNSSAYVQRQTDLMLKDLRDFAKIYIDDIVFFFKSLSTHLKHLNVKFQRLSKYDVTLNSKKSFLKYSSIILLDQIIDVFEMIIVEKKLAVISKLTFSEILKKLKTYLDLIGWFRNYVPYYAQMIKSFQRRKTLLLKNNSKKENQKKFFFRQTFLIEATDEKRFAYEHLQKMFNHSSFLIHFNSKRFFFVNVNAFKKRNFEKMIFHVLCNFKSGQDVDIKRTKIQSILFLNKQLSKAETRYWFTKFEMTDVIWIIKKLRHFIKSCKKSSVVIFIDHSVTIDLISQTSFITVNTDKLNLKLIQTFQFLSTLSIRIRIKPKRLHIISDALSRLTIRSENKSIKEINILENLNDIDIDIMFFSAIIYRKIPSWDVKSFRVNEVLDACFEKGLSLMKMNEEFFTTLKEIYETNNQWRKIRAKLRTQTDRMNTFDGIEFILKEDQIYYASKKMTSRLCISWVLEKKIYALIHDDNHHCDFHRAYVRISESLYIRHLVKRLRKYIKYCRQCIEDQITRYALYEELHFIKTLALLFHTMIIDFILALSEISAGLDFVLITTNKFFKRINLMSKKSIWTASE